MVEEGLTYQQAEGIAKLIKGLDHNLVKIANSLVPKSEIHEVKSCLVNALDAANSLIVMLTLHCLSFVY